MSKKVLPSQSNRLKLAVDSEDDLDQKFDSLYTEHRSKTVKESKDTDDRIDLKQLYIEHAKPHVMRITLFARLRILPKIKAFIVRVGVVRWGLGILAVLFSVSMLNLLGGADNAATPSAVQGVATESVFNSEPEFEIISAPEAKEFRYDAERRVVSYADQIAGAQAVISQQQISNEQANDDTFLLQVAQSFNLQTEFQTDNGGVFVGDNRDQQIQTAILTYDELLIFIQIQSILEPFSIIEYVNALE